MLSLKNKIKIGTRGSPLALAQSVYVRDLLKQAGNLSDDCFEIIPIQTSGDQFLNVKLHGLGGKGLFTKEIEQALLDKTIDIAVHSGKDVPIKRKAGLRIMATPPREDYRDAYVSLTYPSIADLPPNACIGTASARRTAQIRYLRPDIQIILLRGNIQTRLKKLQDNLCDATLLACAGLKRMHMLDIATQILDIDTFLPAPAQGIIMVESRDDVSDDLSSLLRKINCSDTFDRAITERAALEAFEGSCETPIAALSEIKGNDMHLIIEFLSPDGRFKIRKEATAPRHAHHQMGIELGHAIKEEYIGRVDN